CEGPGRARRMAGQVPGAAPGSPPGAGPPPPPPAERPGLDRRRLLVGGGALVGAGIIVGGGVVIARYLSGLHSSPPAATTGPPGTQRGTAQLIGASGGAAPASADNALVIPATDAAAQRPTVHAPDA